MILLSSLRYDYFLLGETEISTLNKEGFTNTHQQTVTLRCDDQPLSHNYLQVNSMGVDDVQFLAKDTSIYMHNMLSRQQRQSAIH